MDVLQNFARLDKYGELHNIRSSDEMLKNPAIP